jgi:hypothetical protein
MSFDRQRRAGKPAAWIAAVLLMGVSFQISAQDALNPDTVDVELWAGAKISVKLGDAWRLDLAEQIRTKDNLGVYEHHHHQAALSWSPEWNKVSDAQFLSVGLRHTSALDDTGGKQGFERFVRTFAQYGGSAKYERWEFGWRAGYQQTRALYLAGGDDPIEEPIQSKWRYRMTLGYNFKSWDADPELAYEYFPEGEADAAYPEPRHRWRLVTDLKFDKRNHVKLFVQRQHGPELYSGLARTEVRWALGLIYHHRSRAGA